MVWHEVISHSHKGNSSKLQIVRKYAKNMEKINQKISSIHYNKEKKKKILHLFYKQCDNCTQLHSIPELNFPSLKTEKERIF